MVTGLPAEQLTVTVAPRVTSTVGTSFAPTLGLALTPLQLKLAGDPTTLTVQDSTAVQQSTQVSRTLSLLGRRISVATGRTVSTVVLFVASLAGVALLLLARHLPVPHRCGHPLELDDPHRHQGLDRRDDPWGRAEVAVPRPVGGTVCGPFGLQNLVVVGHLRHLSDNGFAQAGQASR